MPRSSARGRKVFGDILETRLGLQGSRELTMTSDARTTRSPGVDFSRRAVRPKPRVVPRAGLEISPATIRTRSQVSLGPRFRVLRLSRPASDAISWSLTVVL